MLALTKNKQHSLTRPMNYQWVAQQKNEWKVNKHPNNIGTVEILWEYISKIKLPQKRMFNAPKNMMALMFDNYQFDYYKVCNQVGSFLEIELSLKGLSHRSMKKILTISILHFAGNTEYSTDGKSKDICAYHNHKIGIYWKYNAIRFWILESESSKKLEKDARSILKDFGDLEESFNINSMVTCKSQK